MIRVTVMRAMPDEAIEIEVELPSGATVDEALAQSGIAADKSPIGIYGRRVSRQTVVADGDRIEIYRRMIAEPNDAGRSRAARRERRGEKR